MILTRRINNILLLSKPQLLTSLRFHSTSNNPNNNNHNKVEYTKEELEQRDKIR
jgi:hypothetical protein